MVALIEMKLPESIALQLNSNRKPEWCGVDRVMVRDLIDVTSKPNVIIVNPGGVKENGIENAGAYDGKAIIYAAIDICMDEWYLLSPGFHEAKVNKNKARVLRAFRFRTDENGKWICYRWQNGGAITIRFKEAVDPETVYLRDSFQNNHDMLDLVVQGAYAEIDLSDAPGLYQYFLKLMSLDPDAAREVSAFHLSQKIAFNDEWQKSKDVEIIDEQYLIDGEWIAADVVKSMPVVVASNDDKGYSRKVPGKNLAYLTQLHADGYVLSVP